MAVKAMLDRRNTGIRQMARCVVPLLAAAYVLAIVHPVLPGAHESHEHLAAHQDVAAGHDGSAGVQSAPVCPHRLPELDLDGQPDCALCKLTRSIVGPHYGSGASYTIAVPQAAVPPVFPAPGSLDHWQPASRRGPPILS